MNKVIDKVYTLTKLNQSIENWVKTQFSSKEIWVSCQIVKFNQSGGHYYLELEDSINGVRTASAQGVIWRSSFLSIEQIFKSYGLKIEDVLKIGHQIKALVRIDFHKIYGFKLMIQQIDPISILGDIEKQKQETLKRLEKEGLLELQKQIKFSSINKRIAIIGSPDTSGFNDFIHELFNNSVYTKFKVKIFPTKVQGENAINEISKAIREANNYNVDAIVLIRGGGSKMDLHIFNHYDICKAIAYSRFPVITGIGHENDNTLVDLVAKVGEKTPTAAAKLFYIKIGQFFAMLDESSKDIRINVMSLITERSKELDHFTKQTYSVTTNTIQYHRDKLIKEFDGTKNHIREYLNTEKDLIREFKQTIYSITRIILKHSTNNFSLLLNSIQQAFNKVIASEHNIISSNSSKINAFALNIIIKEKPKELDTLNLLLRTRLLHFISFTKDDLIFQIEKLSLVDPTLLFKKGYTISTINGVDVNKIKDDVTDEILHTYTDNLILESKIIKAIKND